MRPLTFTRPKVLVPAAGLPLLEHIFRRLAAAGVDEALLITMYLPEQVRAWADQAGMYGIRIATADQPKDKYGTGAATLAAREWVGDEPFVMTFGDVLAVESHYPALVGLHRAEPEATILSAYRQDAVRGGLVRTSDGFLSEIIERPPEPVPNGLINAGVFLLQPHVFDHLATLPPSPRGEYELTDVFHTMTPDGAPPRVIEVDGYWVNVSGGPEILEVQSRVLDEWRGSGSDGVFVDEGATVAEGAELVGPVRVAPGAVIGASRVGPYVAVGEGARVADGCDLADSELLRNASVADGCRLRYCILGEGAKLASGARVSGETDRTVVIADNEEHPA